MLTTTCRLCGDMLGKSVVGDEYGYRDRDGDTTGVDADLRHLNDPYARLAELASLMDQPGPHPAAWIKEYVALKVRMEMSSGWHTHQPTDLIPLDYDHAPPDHCGMPPWLRPSGWWCRQCGARLADNNVKPPHGGFFMPGGSRG